MLDPSTLILRSMMSLYNVRTRSTYSRVQSAVSTSSTVHSAKTSQTGREGSGEGADANGATHSTQNADRDRAKQRDGTRAQPPTPPPARTLPEQSQRPKHTRVKVSCSQRAEPLGQKYTFSHLCISISRGIHNKSMLIGFGRGAAPRAQINPNFRRVLLCIPLVSEIY